MANPFRQHTFLFAYIMLAVVGLAVHSLTFFIPIYMDSLGFSGFQIGLLYAVMSITGLLFIFFIGVLTDRISARLIAVLGILFIAAQKIGFAYAELFWIVFILFFLGGIGERMYHMAFDTFTLKKIASQKGTKFGVYSFMKSVPGAVGMVLGGYLLYLTDFNIMLLVVGLIVLATLVFVKFIPDTERSVESVRHYFKDFANKRVIFFSILLFIFTLHWGVESTSYGLFLRENLGLSFIQMGWFMAVPILFLGLASVWTGWFIDRDWSPRLLLFLCFVVSGGGIALMAYFTDPFLSFVFRIIHEIGDGIFAVFVFVGASSFFTKKRIGGNFGMIGLITVLGKFAGSLIFGPMGDAYGYHVPHIVCGLLIAVSGLFLLFFRKHEPDFSPKAENVPVKG
ncbi:MFS transporter [Candidatus Woesearchaeota archaeon]|nr:MFS transporter [Candidatus Woesearchaeota archaeon]